MTVSREMLCRLRGLFSKGSEFVAWVFSPEFLICAPLLPSKRREDFFLREMLKPEILETKPVIPKQTTGFLKWLFEKENLQ
ncbi:MAG: hypothetical protein HY877_06240 [Deltaproteobacteria bacterium]|nr:hypothetical protein [Deltaproteobacteria bacterium]